MRITLRQLSQPEILSRWPEIEPRVTKILAWSKGSYSTGWVYTGLDRKMLYLFEVRVREDGRTQDGGKRAQKHAGWAIIQRDNHSTKEVLYLWGLYIEPGIVGWQEGLDLALDELARRWNCQEIRAKSPRYGWERVAEKMRWEQMSVEYGKRVSCEIQRG